MNKIKKNIRFILICVYTALIFSLFVISSPSVLAVETASNSTFATVSTYNKGSQTILPDFEKGTNEADSDPMYKEYDKEKDKATKTTITICKWDEWECDKKDDGTYKFTKKSYTTNPSSTYRINDENELVDTDYAASAIYTPMNEKGLKDAKKENGNAIKDSAGNVIEWTTRSGYGFAIDSYFNVQNITNDPIDLRASLLLPEFNFSTDKNKFYDMKVNTKDESNHAAIETIKIEVNDTGIKSSNDVKVVLSVNDVKNIADIIEIDVSKFVFESKDETVAKVNEDGYITAKGNGITTIVAKSEDVNTVFTYSFSLGNNLIGKYDEVVGDYKITGSDNLETKQHFTPMWYKDGSYTPTIKIGGLWSPIAEVRYNLTQKKIPVLENYKSSNAAKILMNDYIIKGSLFDDMYTTHDKFKDS